MRKNIGSKKNKYSREYFLFQMNNLFLGMDLDMLMYIFDILIIFFLYETNFFLNILFFDRISKLVYICDTLIILLNTMNTSKLFFNIDIRANNFFLNQCPFFDRISKLVYICDTFIYNY